MRHLKKAACNRISPLALTIVNAGRWSDAQADHKESVLITGLKLGPFRIREQNDGDHREPSPICGINAVDGSIIDRNRGY